MLKVIGTATITFSINLNVDDITTKAMPIEKSNYLIAEAILEKHGVIAHNIHVEEIHKIKDGGKNE